MMTRWKVVWVHVRRADIKKGGIEPINCPVALAIQRRVPKSTNVEVTGPAAYIDGKRCVLTDRVRHFIKAYDQGKPVNPFYFSFKVYNKKENEK